MYDYEHFLSLADFGEILAPALSPLRGRWKSKGQAPRPPVQLLMEQIYGKPLPVHLNCLLPTHINGARRSPHAWAARMNSTIADAFHSFLVFLVIILEIALAAALFFAIIAAAHWLRVFLDSLHEQETSLIYIVARGGEIVLLVVDCVIGALFVSRGVYRAWKETWGRKAG
jgi:hypothetical protein